MKDAISLRKSLSVLGILIVTSGLMFTGLVKAAGTTLPPPVGAPWTKLDCYCFDPNNHVALSAARAECDSLAVQSGFPHGFVRPLTTPNYDGMINVCIPCDDVEYACFVADPPKRHIHEEQ